MSGTFILCFFSKPFLVFTNQLLSEIGKRYNICQSGELLLILSMLMLYLKIDIISCGEVTHTAR